ncbi:MAG: ECF transporter S component [Deferribacteres bacterium]|nr:ECF transporter S component [candidate division KSB1 bacterium]MCB9512325.1 ECF transporter S component [Deferribacteres bacterium]
MISHTTRKIVTGGMFIALAIGLGYALSSFPNIELVTACVFLSGYFLGWRMGTVVGAIAMFIYSAFNPYGMPTPPLLASQIIAMAIAGLTGALLRTPLEMASGRNKVILLAVAGAGLTLLFDFLTTVGDVLFLSLTMQSSDHIFKIFIARVAFGIGFFVTHIVANTLIFAALLPHFIRKLDGKILAVVENVPAAVSSTTADEL